MSLSTVKEMEWNEPLLENSKIRQSDEELAKMLVELAKPRPQRLAEIDTSSIPEIFGCVRCGKIPDPDNVMACETGHYSCGDCIFRGKNEGIGDDKLESCCDLRNLRKEPPHLLKTLLDNALFRCENHEKGCQEQMMGYQKFHEHIRACHLSTYYKCRFHDCREKRKSPKEILVHYIEDHDGTVVAITKGNVILPIDFKEMSTQRLVAILRVKDQHFVFACEVKNEMVFIWIWDLENEAVGVGRKTCMGFHLRLKQVRKLPIEGFEELCEFKGRCVFHAIEPNEIVTTGGSFVDYYKLDVETFKKMFVEKTVDGNGKCTMVVHVKRESK